MEKKLPFLQPETFSDLLADLVLFIDVARAGSLSHAATVNRIALSTLSRRLADLEKSLGVRLIDRSTRRFRLTQDGELYAATLSDTIMQAKGLLETLRSDAKALRGTLRVSATPDFGTFYLGPILSEFAHRYPEMEIAVDLSPRLANVISDGFDVTIHMGDLPDSNLIIRRLARVANSLYAAPSYLDSKPPVQHPEDLRGHTCISLPHQKGKWTLTQNGEVVIAIAGGRLTANNVSFVRHLAVAAHGIVCLGDLIAQPELETGRLVRVLPEWQLEPVNVLAVTASKLLSPRVRSFVDFMSERLAPLHND